MQFVLRIGGDRCNGCSDEFYRWFLRNLYLSRLRRIVPETKLDKRLIAIGTVMGGLCLGMVLFIIFINR